jgi:[ribosomal protein S5]-alanine N-acetyltransferase
MNKHNFHHIETPRLRLRSVNDEEYVYVLKTYSDEDLAAFFNLNSAEEISKERERAVKGLSTFNKSLLLFYLIDKTTDKTIGWCGYHTWYTQHNRAEIGYVMSDENARNKGLMSEALSAILHYGFNDMNLHRVEAFVGKENVASLKLMNTFGFKQEGVLREHYFTNNRHEDSLVFGLLKHEFN